MATSLGTIPEDFPITGVYTAPPVTDLPQLVYGERPTFSELIWDRDSGFTDNWRDRSSLTGAPGAYVFLLGRRAFSAAGMAIFAGAETGGGGGGSTSDDISNESTAPGATVTDALDDHEDRIQDLEAGGGGSFSITPTPVVDGNLVELEGTGGTTGKDSGISAASVAAALATVAGISSQVVYKGSLTSPGTLTYASNVWSNLISAVTGGTFVDETQSGITRSGTNFTVFVAGWYNFAVMCPAYSAGTPPLSALRIKVNGTVVDSKITYPGTTTAQTAEMNIISNVLLAAADVVSFEYAHAIGAPSFTITNNQVTGANVKLLSISIIRIGASTQPVASSTAGGWQRVVDTNFTQLAPQTLGDGANTIAGIPYTLGNISSAADYARVDSTGLTVKVNAVNGGNHFLDASTTPTVKIRLRDIAPDFVLGESKLRMWAQYGSNGNANHENVGFGLTRRPWNGGVGTNWYYIWAVGAYDSLNPHNGIIVGRGTSVAGRVDRDFTSVTPANNPATSFWGISFRDFDDMSFYTRTASPADNVATDTANKFSQMTLRAQMRGASAIVSGGQTVFGNQVLTPITDQSAVMTTMNADDIDISILSLSTYNTAAHLIATMKRLVIEVQY